MLIGTYAGNLLGNLLGVNANVGGVGISMVLLILLSNMSNKKLHLNARSESGIYFWSALYIPIVVAMAAKQNVIAAVSSGWLAVIAGVLAVAVSFAVIPLISRFEVGDEADHEVR
jgi:malonate transporter MadL subunit